MKIFGLIQKKFTSIGYLSAEQNSGSDFYHIIAPILIAFTLILMEVAATIYSWRHFQMGDIENSLYAGLDVPGTALVIGTFLSVLYKKENVRIVIDALQDIFDKCENLNFISVGLTRLQLNTIYLQVKIPLRQFSLLKPTNLLRNC